MEFLNIILDEFFSFQAYVMLPFFIFIIALIVRMNISKAFVSSLKMGVGFAGVFIVFAFFVDNIKPAVESIMVVRNLDLPVLDVGWPPLAAITWSSSLAPISIPLIIGINILMLATSTTRTIYIDIWNYWHLALAGSFVFSITQSMVMGVTAVILITVYAIKMADWSAPHVEQQANLPGVTIAPVSVVGLLPFAVTMDYIYDKIPLINKLQFNPEKEKRKIGVFSEPMIIGLIIGVLLGLGAGYSTKGILELGVHIAAVMFLLPKCGQLIGEGITPVSEALKVWIQRRFQQKKELYVAINAVVLLTNKSVIVTGLLLMPITLLISLVLPGNRILPLGDLPNLLALLSITVLVSRGNVVRSVLTGLPIVTTFLIIANHLAPLITRLSSTSGINIDDTYVITAFADGGNHARFFLIHLFQGEILAIVVIPIVLLMVYLSYRKAKDMAAK